VDYATTMMKSNGPSHAVGHKSSKRSRYALEREQCVCAVGKRVCELTKNKSPSPLTRPTSLEMLSVLRYFTDLSSENRDSIEVTSD
jgi:hypothetical protein